MTSEKMQRPSAWDRRRRRTTAYLTTLRLYQEIKFTVGAVKPKDDLGFSSGRVVKVCLSDFIADVEKVSKAAVKDSPALDRMFLRDALEGNAVPTTWLGTHATPKELVKIRRRVEQKVGAAFLFLGIHPFAAYTKPVDVR